MHNNLVNSHCLLLRTIHPSFSLIKVIMAYHSKGFERNLPTVLLVVDLVAIAS